MYKSYKIEVSDDLSEKYETIVHKITNENHTRANFDTDQKESLNFEE